MGIRIVLLRHAKPLADGHAEDHLRPLSEEGKKQEHRLVEKLKEMKIIPTHIFTSPFVRAKETAEILAESFGLEPLDEPSLGASYDSQVLFNKIANVNREETVFLVGHAPSLENFFQLLVDNGAIPGGLSKSSALIIGFETRVAIGQGKLLQYIKT